MHLRENSRPVEVIVLRPAVEGMIMALRALQPRSQEKLGDRFRSRRRFPVCAIKICGRVLISAPAGCQNVARRTGRAACCRRCSRGPNDEKPGSLSDRGPFPHCATGRTISVPRNRQTRPIKEIGATRRSRFCEWRSATKARASEAVGRIRADRRTRALRRPCQNKGPMDRFRAGALLENELIHVIRLETSLHFDPFRSPTSATCAATCDRGSAPKRAFAGAWHRHQPVVATVARLLADS